MVELSSCTYFQQNIDVVGVLKASVHSDDIGMGDEHLNFDFPNELVYDFLLMDELFG